MIRNYVRFLVSSVVAALLAGTVAGPVLAEIRVDIRQGHVEPLPIAVTGCAWNSGYGTSSPKPR